MVSCAPLCLPLHAEIYHTTFDWPQESEVQNRLVQPEGISEMETAQKLLEYHRSIIRVLPAYSKVLKAISADQPCVDVFYQGKHKHAARPGHCLKAKFTVPAHPPVQGHPG